MIHRENGRAALEGGVTIATVPLLLRECLDALRQGVREFDFRGVHEVDSAALGLIIECQREALRSGAPLRCTNLPENLKSLAALYGVQTLIAAL